MRGIASWLCLAALAFVAHFLAYLSTCLRNHTPSPTTCCYSPDDTAWEGGTFKLTMHFTEDYPNKPPVVKFVCRLFHPNVYADGGICLDILQNNWSPIYDIAAVLTSIQSLLCDPNPNSPANSEAARLFQENPREYHKRVQATVEASWT